jgi:hypothetical protein
LAFSFAFSLDSQLPIAYCEAGCVSNRIYIVKINHAPA